MTVTIDGNTVDFLAVQGSKSDQISLGAVNDGYPILPVVDPNDDGRFTIRELRELRERLDAFDDNGDGALTADETHSTIRVCLGLGPTVHRQLAVLRSINEADTAAAATGPEWFRQMDRNNDNDISRTEFSGTKEQFAERDTDSDDLISVQEALAAEKQP